MGRFKMAPVVIYSDDPDFKPIKVEGLHVPSEYELTDGVWMLSVHDYDLPEYLYHVLRYPNLLSCDDYDRIEEMLKQDEEWYLLHKKSVQIEAEEQTPNPPSGE